jgi:hypothetical protein
MKYFSKNFSFNNYSKQKIKIKKNFSFNQNKKLFIDSIEKNFSINENKK